VAEFHLVNQYRKQRAMPLHRPFLRAGHGKTGFASDSHFDPRRPYRRRTTGSVMIFDEFIGGRPINGQIRVTSLETGSIWRPARTGVG
jgi:hypothetical protein